MEVVLPLSLFLAIALVAGSIQAAVWLAKKSAKDPTSQVLLASILSGVFSGIVLFGLWAGGRALKNSLLVAASIFFFWIAAAALFVGAWWTACRLAEIWAKNPGWHVLLGFVLGLIFSAIVVGGAYAGCGAAMNFK